MKRRLWILPAVALAAGPAVRRPHGTYALRFAGFGEVGHVEQWYRMNKARNFDEWRAATVPALNTVYADGEGNVHYVYNARLPLRADGYDRSRSDRRSGGRFSGLRRTAAGPVCATAVARSAAGRSLL